MLKSRITAVASVIITLAAIVVNCIMGFPWWALIPEFFAYMAAFSHLVALLLNRRVPVASATLEKCAFVCSGCFCLAVVVLSLVFLLD